jgi:hypothetical protein
MTGCEVLDWAASGGMNLTGHQGGPPSARPAAGFGLLARVCDAFARLTGVRADPSTILTERARRENLRRKGHVSANGKTRLIHAADGWCAITLSRPDDLAAVPAIIGSPAVSDPWDALESAARQMSATDLAARVQLLGVPGAALPAAPPAGTATGCRTSRIAPAGSVQLDGAVVADLSAMWAGPLCGQLLTRAGARVIKVESATRPDGARGHRSFFNRLHAGQQQVVIDFGSRPGRAELAGLLRAADIVIESSRPRALRQLGLAPEVLPHREGQVWLSITGYGRGDPDKVAFGDDAAVAGGLVGLDDDGDPVFCADAIADPLSGVRGALAVAEAVAAGGGMLIDLSMRDVAAMFAAAPPECDAEHPVLRAGFGWRAACSRLKQSQWVLPPC